MSTGFIIDIAAQMFVDIAEEPFINKNSFELSRPSFAIDVCRLATGCRISEGAGHAGFHLAPIGLFAADGDL